MKYAGGNSALEQMPLRAFVISLKFLNNWQVKLNNRTWKQNNIKAGFKNRIDCHEGSTSLHWKQLFLVASSIKPY